MQRYETLSDGNQSGCQHIGGGVAGHSYPTEWYRDSVDILIDDGAAPAAPHFDHGFPLSIEAGHDPLSDNWERTGLISGRLADIENGLFPAGDYTISFRLDSAFPGTEVKVKSFGGANVSFALVPEPHTALLLALGLVALTRRTERRRRPSAS